MTGLLHDPREDFLAKVLPIATDLVEETGFAVKSGSPVTRGLNLAMGAEPKNKAEREFQANLLRAIWRAHPGVDYPAICASAPSDVTERLH